jgi:hypothetical protein
LKPELTKEEAVAVTEILKRAQKAGLIALEETPAVAALWQKLDVIVKYVEPPKAPDSPGMTPDVSEDAKRAV